MGTQISNIRKLKDFGIWNDRNSESSDFSFRRYNLIYGFNGSGKSTLSRLFATLRTGTRHPRLPDQCIFEVVMDDGGAFGHPSKPSGLERRVLVFNADYIEENLQWSTGRANPVFYIGADQAEAASQLDNIERKIAVLSDQLSNAQQSLDAAQKAFSSFKRERARLTAVHLYLGNRKYEAPALTKDYDSWHQDIDLILQPSELEAAKQVRQKEDPMPNLTQIYFDTNQLQDAFNSTLQICGQSLTTVALDEVQRFPEMLLWLKEGHRFHIDHAQDECLFCGNPIKGDRMTLLRLSLDDKIDRFIEALDKEALRLTEVMNSLHRLEASILPKVDAMDPALRQSYVEILNPAIDTCRLLRTHFSELQRVLTSKKQKPASSVDTSMLLDPRELALIIERLTSCITSIGAMIIDHNTRVDEFSAIREKAEIDIRKHFIGECYGEYKELLHAIDNWKSKQDSISAELVQNQNSASNLRQKIRTHGPAATKMNSLIASYLGHQELSVQTTESGYELYRHGRIIHGPPSEGEKTAIAISYFLTSIEADGRKLKNCIVVIDDPVSSLDTKSLNFACALVRTRLEEANQLFILTHNLQCMNEFKKSWKGRSRPKDGNPVKPPTAAFYFIEVKMQTNEGRRKSFLKELPRLLRDYDSEYHYLFSQVFAFSEDPDSYTDHGYMMPNLLRRVLDVFLAFRCPGSSGLSGQISKLCSDYPGLDRDRLVALERLAQVESHSDNIDDLLHFSTMTLEEIKAATAALLSMMEEVDNQHLQALKRLCRA